MLSSNINPNEASVTAVTRLAAGKNDGGYAFDLIKRMNTEFNIVPRLRTYDPALFCFCENLEADKAYEVEEHMGLMGVSLEEPEIAALLKVSSETGRGDRVYGYLQKLRNMGGCVSEETGRVIEAWFDGEKGSEVKGVSCDVGMLKEAILKKGGGWHGMGWIGEGKWVVKKGSVDESGQCCCGEQLCCVDIDDVETERFAQSIAGLALEREVKANFSEFQVSGSFPPFFRLSNKYMHMDMLRLTFAIFFFLLGIVIMPFENRIIVKWNSRLRKHYLILGDSLTAWFDTLAFHFFDLLKSMVCGIKKFKLYSPSDPKACFLLKPK